MHEHKWKCSFTKRRLTGKQSGKEKEEWNPSKGVSRETQAASLKRLGVPLHAVGWSGTEQQQGRENCLVDPAGPWSGTKSARKQLGDRWIRSPLAVGLYPGCDSMVKPVGFSGGGSRVRRTGPVMHDVGCNA